MYNAGFSPRVYNAVTYHLTRLALPTRVFSHDKKNILGNCQFYL